MPVIAVMNAAKIATAVYTIVLASALTYQVIKVVREDHKKSSS